MVPRLGSIFIRRSCCRLGAGRERAPLIDLEIHKPQRNERKAQDRQQQYRNDSPPPVNGYTPPRVGSGS